MADTVQKLGLPAATAFRDQMMRVALVFRNVAAT